MNKIFRIIISTFSLLAPLIAGIPPAPVYAGGAQPLDNVQPLVGEQGENLPSGLTPADWNQIRALLPAEAVNQQAYFKASNTDAADGFGYSVAVSDNTLVVGAPFEDSNATGVNGNQKDNSTSSAGAAYVFIRNSQGAWSQQAYLKASNTNADDRFGSSVAISGDTIVVGAFWEDSSTTGVNGNENDNSAFNAGAAYVFIRSGTTWSQQAYLKASNTDNLDRFGSSVAISGDVIVVGAPGEESSATGVNGNQDNNTANSAGAAYIFIRSGPIWSQEAYLKASNTDAYDEFGSSVAISTNTIAVGAPSEDSSSAGVNGNQNDNSASKAGAAYVFHRNSEGAWSQQAYLKASNTNAEDLFGYSIATSGSRIVVGALLEDSSATGVNGNQKDNSADATGAAYVFKRRYDIRNHVWVWHYTTYLKASNTGAGDRFGYSVAISSSTIVVGAIWEESSAKGVNGNQNDNSASGAGAAYLFKHDGAGWSQQSYLKAFNTDAGDEFGSSVAISGNSIVVGAHGEDSSATGVNGNGGDNWAIGSGAAYVFGEKIELRSQAKYDGWALESGEFTNQGGTINNLGKVLAVGDNIADRQYRSILSFGTGAIPDNAVITKVTLMIKKAGVVGTDPMKTHNGLVVDIKKGKFYTLPALQINDFQAKPGKYGVGKFPNKLYSGWYRSILNSAAFPYINKQGLTQLRLRFRLDDNDDNGADILKLYSGNAVLANRPQLFVEYFVP